MFTSNLVFSFAVCTELAVNSSYSGTIDGIYTKTTIACDFVASFRRDSDNIFLYYNNNDYWIIGSGLCAEDSYMDAYARVRASEVTPENTTGRWEEKDRFAPGPETTWRRSDLLSVVCLGK
jgi:hypothetical protein